MCSYRFEPETINHYLLRCKLFSNLRRDLNGVSPIEKSLKKFSDENKICCVFLKNLHSVQTHKTKFLKVNNHVA